ncbi:single-stranded DNA-binding protein [Cellulomonas sp. Marseille-Q8402]
MAVNELAVTVVGLVGSDPTCYRGDEGQVPFTRFRLASTPRVYDREQDAYVDGGTSWFTVKAFRQLALNVAECVRRGEPVLVHGRLRLVDWVTPEGQHRTTGEITADSVGYDMNRGTSRFTRTVHGPGAGAAPATGAAPGGDGAGPGEGSAGQGGPVDLTGAVVLEDDDPGDRVTGAPIA